MSASRFLQHHTSGLSFNFKRAIVSTAGGNSVAVGQLNVKNQNTRNNSIGSVVGGGGNKCGIEQQTKKTMATSAKVKKLVTLDCMNPNVIKMEYAVRGPLVIRAAAIEKELNQVNVMVVYLSIFQKVKGFLCSVHPI